MMKKRVKERGAVLLAIALAFSALTYAGAHAANAVDTNASCSAAFSIGGDFEELKEVNVPIHLYKVASIRTTGAYTAEEGYESLDLASIESSESSADTWLTRAADAAKLAEADEPAASVETDGGLAAVKNLAAGLYLVMAEDVQSDYCTYSFTPYLISLPNNYYESTGDDTWVYDLTGTHAIGLKPEQKERFGSLKIVKELVNHHISMGEKATFVFQIDITTLDGGKESRQVALAFDGYGSDSVTIGEIPAGAAVTVTEIYSGAGYELTADSAKEQTVTILADETVETSFKNEHDGTPAGGHGVVNHFELDENDQYDWSQMEGHANHK